MLIANNIGMVQFFHDVDLLVDIFLEEGFLLNVKFAYDLNCVENICRL